MLGNGIVSYDRDPADDGRYPAETVATFRCLQPLHSLYGDESATCETSSTWSHQTPTCNGNEIKFSHSYNVFCFQNRLKFKWVCKNIFVASCSPLMLGNGIVSYDRDPAGNGRYPAETIATFICNHLHSLYGDESATCQTSSTWSHKTPTCNGNEIKFSHRNIVFYLQNRTKMQTGLLKYFCRILFTSKLGKWYCKL